MIEARGVVKGYRTPAGYLKVLDGLDLSVAAGEMVAVVGASGIGKSTLLHVVGALDRPEAGTAIVAGSDLATLSPDALATFRSEAIGFVFQFHHLLPEFTALENVMMPMLIARRPEAEARATALALLTEMGVAERAEHRPAMLSGGEQQRVAVARALVRSPRLLLADEPTGNLDRETGDRLHELLRRLNREKGLTILVVTHNERLAGLCDRVLRIEAGRLGTAPGAIG
ncbi:MAG: ABC transporter ATP-binding protein [Vicinamibacteria bacterium]|nr:ABC transporter ATP-binding protein [Vicinamibacteria bacterium]